MIWFFVRGTEHHGRSVHALATATQLTARFSAVRPYALKLEGWQLSPICSAAGAEERS